LLDEAQKISPPYPRTKEYLLRLDQEEKRVKALRRNVIVGAVIALAVVLMIVLVMIYFNRSHLKKTEDYKNIGNLKDAFLGDTLVTWSYGKRAGYF